MSAKRKIQQVTETPDFDLSGFVAASTNLVNDALDRFLPSERTRPATIHKAMRYSHFAGGKRMRPALTLAAAQACGGKRKMHCRSPAQSSASTRIPSCMTTSPPWTTMTIAAAN